MVRFYKKLNIKRSVHKDKVNILIILKINLEKIVKNVRKKELIIFEFLSILKTIFFILKY